MPDSPEPPYRMEETIRFPTEDHALLVDFIAEARASLEDVRRDLLALEGGPGDADLIHRLFRAFHSIKGVAGVLSPGQVEALAHETEQLLVPVRTGAVPLDVTLSAKVLEASSKLQSLLDDLNSAIAKEAERPDRVTLVDLFHAMSRLAHDVACRAGKEVEVFISAPAIPLHRRVYGALRQAMMQLVRNCVDHGVEQPADRRRAGKPHRGRIEFNARQHKDSLHLQITDDGRGLDAEKIAARAGLMASRRAMSDEQVWRLIFAPGLTTTDAVSYISGRGVGMDVVRRSIEDIGGSVGVASSRGHGTTFTICLPGQPAPEGK